jgi:hypothetical protein
MHKCQNMPRNRPIKEQKRPINIGVPQVPGSAVMLEASRVHGEEGRGEEGRGEECRKRKCMALVRELSGQSLDEDVFWRENFQNRERYIQMMKHLEKVRLCVWVGGGVRVKGSLRFGFRVVSGYSHTHTHTQHTHTQTQTYTDTHRHTHTHTLLTLSHAHPAHTHTRARNRQQTPTT